jgi:hypothetical protein
MALNPYQKNSLEVEMTQLETALLKARQFLRHPPENGLLTYYKPVPEAVRSRLETLIDAMLAEIAIVVREFDLQPREEDIGRGIDAEMAVAWADLYDSLSPKLVRYGDVDPTLAATLDPHLEQLIALAQALGLAARTGEGNRSSAP